MKIREFEHMRYHVESETDPKADPYLVDLLEYNGNGKCDCTNFRVEIGPVLEGTKKLTPEEREKWAPVCKHIVLANLRFAKEMKRRIIKHQITCKNTINSDSQKPTSRPS